MTLAFVLSGFGVGILVGLTGVGGGSLMTPLLTLFGINPAIAVGTDLAFASITKTAGTFTHRLRGTVEWPVVRLLCYGALPAAIITIFILDHLGGVTKELIRLIRYSVAASVMLTVIALLFKGKMLDWLNRHPDKQLQGSTLAVSTVVSGALLGSLVTISSIGAGAIGATLLVALYPRMPAARIAGTDIAYAVPLTAIAAIGHWWLGSIDWNLLTSLLVGSLPGITIGSLAAKAVPEKLLRGILATTLTLVAAKMVL